MQITSSIICRQASSFVPTIISTASQSGVGSILSQTIKDISFSVTTTNTGTLAYNLTQIVPQFLPDWILTSETPFICEVSGSIVNKISDGIGIIRLSGPYGFSKVIPLDFNSTNTDSNVWTGFSGLSKSLKLSNPILSLLSQAKQKNIFSYNPTVKNINCWASALDLTGSPVSTSFGGKYGTANSGALITPQHWVGVPHWGNNVENMGPGANISCVGSDGIVHTRTVTNRYIHPIKDIMVSRLSSAFPSTVKPFKLTGSTMIDIPNQRMLGLGWQITQEKNITPVGFDDFTKDFKSLSRNGYVRWDSMFYGNDKSNHRMNGLSELLQKGKIGDSGGAVGGYYNGETYLISLFTGSESGHFYGESQAIELNEIISILDSSFGSNTNYNASVLNLIPN